MKKIWTLLLCSGLLLTAVPAQNDSYREIPFELSNGMIMVQATVNGDTGTFVIDTGSPKMVVNTQSVNDLRLSGPVPQLAHSQSLSVKVNHFSWAGREHQDMDALAMDISHLETASREKVLGVIGFDILKDYEILFDFERQVLMLLPPRGNWMHELHEPLFSLRFRMNGQLPVLQGNIAGRKVRFGLDTGGTNLLSKDLYDELPAELRKPLEPKRILGFGNTTHRMLRAQVGELSVDRHGFEPAAFVFADLPYLKEYRIDGLLGLPFLGQFRFSINYDKQRIYFWRYDSQTVNKRI